MSIKPSPFATLMLGVSLLGPLAGPVMAAPGPQCYFGECAPGTTSVPAAPPPPRPAAADDAPGSSMRVIGEHGSWVAVAVDGRTSIVMDRFDDGTRVGIVLRQGGGRDLLVIHPDWSLETGRSYALKVEIDGDRFSGSARAVDATTLRLDDVAASFLEAIHDGRRAVLAVGSFSLEMSTLSNAAAALDDVVRRTTATAD